MGLQFLLLFGLFWVDAFEFTTTTKSGCAITKVHRMRAADCYDKNLSEFPKSLPSNSEVIDLSYNRIRKISSSDLEKFGSLKILYLQDNMIGKIDETAFDNQDDLTTLDVSLNGIISLPPVIFQLPSLQNLYLSRNLNINLAETIEKAKPIKSPLMKLDISNNELETLPELGIIPTLMIYNISGNGEIHLKPSHFSGLCNLKVLDTANITGVFFHQCDCWIIENWLKERGVTFTSLDCDKTRIACEVSEEDLAIYSDCRKLYEKLELNERITTIGIPIACTVAVLILIILVYCIMRCKRQRRKTKNFIRKEEKSEGLIAYKS